MAKDVTIIISAKDLATGNIRKVSDQLESTTRKAEKFGETLTKAGSGLTKYLSSWIMAAGYAVTNLGMEVIEGENLFEVSMGNMAQAAREWSEGLREQFGLNAYDVRKFVGTFNVMMNSLGIGEQAAYSMSTVLTQLAYDMSSFYNIRFEDAFTKLQAGITGEIEPLKRLGIVINETTVKTYAYKNGIAAQGAELSEQQKVLARFGLMMQQTSKAQGDLARTIESPSNKLKIMGEQIKYAAAELGTKMMPAILQLMTAAVPLVNMLGVLADKFAGLPPGVQQTIVYVLAAVAALGPLMMAVGGVIKTVTALIGLGKTIAPVLAIAKTKMIAFSAACNTTGTALGGVATGGVAAGGSLSLMLGTVGLLIADFLIWKNVIQGIKDEWDYWGVNFELVVINMKRVWLNFLVWVNETAQKLMPFWADKFKANLDGLEQSLQELTDREAEVGFKVTEIDKRRTTKPEVPAVTTPAFDYDGLLAGLQSYIDGLSALDFDASVPSTGGSVDTALEDLKRFADEKMRLTLSTHDYELWALEEEAKEYREKYRDNAQVLAEFEAYYKAKKASLEKSVTDTIAQERKNLTDQLMRLTLSAHDYELWTLEQQRMHYETTYKGNKAVLDDFYRYYRAMLAKIENDKLSESMALQEDYFNRALQLSMPSDAYRRFALQAERIKFMTEHSDPGERQKYDMYYNAQLAAWDQETADAREQTRKDLVDKTMQLTLSEYEYQVWALEQERIAFEEANEGNSELLDAFAAYYKARMQEITNATDPLISRWERFKQLLADSIGQSALQGMPILNDVIQGAQAGAALGPEGMVAGALAALIPASETFTRLLNVINPVLQAVADAVGRVLEPLLPFYQVLSMSVVPVLQTLGAVLGSVITPMLKAMFPVYKLLGHVMIGVAQAIGTIWNILIGLIDAIPFVDMSDHYIDMKALSDAQKELKNLTWDAAMAMDETAEAARDVSESLRNVPSGFKIALTRFDAAQGIGGSSGGTGSSGSLLPLLPRPKPGEVVLHVHAEGSTFYGVDDFNRLVEQAADRAAAKHGMARSGFRPVASGVY